MDRDFHAYLFKAASAGLIAALAGCAPMRTAQPTITDDTRQRLAQALQDNGDSANAAVVRSQTNRQAGQPIDPLTHATALVTAGQVDEGMKVARAALASHADDLQYACEVGRLAVKAKGLDKRSRRPETGWGIELTKWNDISPSAVEFALASVPPTENILCASGNPPPNKLGMRFICGNVQNQRSS